MPRHASGADPTAAIAYPIMMFIARYGYKKLREYAKDHNLRGDDYS